MKFTLTILLAFAVTAAVHGQSTLEPKKNLKPLKDEWPVYSGDLTGKRYSLLKHIDQSNVANLSLAWATRITPGAGPAGLAPGSAAGSFNRGTLPYPTIVSGLGTGELNTASPFRLGSGILKVGDTLYLSTPDNAWAVDALDGSIIWHYYWKTRGGMHNGNRGMGIFGDWLYFEVADDMLISLDARTGKERWHKEIASFDDQYYATTAPIVIGNHVLVGTSNDTDAPGFLQSYDPETGERQWIHYDVPIKKGDPGLDTWPNLDAARHGGAQAWFSGAYDLETNLYIYGTGNPTPAYTAGRGDGDNLFTCSLVAVDLDTGEMKWYYQTSPHDTHDWDSTEAPVLADIEIGGKIRKVVMLAMRNGYFFTLDRTTGEHLVTGKFGSINNWALGVDDKGHPKRNPASDATIPGTLVNGDITNYPPPSFSPDTGYLYVIETNSLHINYLVDPDPRGSMGLGGLMVGATLPYPSNIDAIDPKTGRIVWKHENGGSQGLLTTAGKLLFSGDGNYFVAYDADSGNPLWHTKIGIAGNAPETYMLDGKQYILATGGDQLWAFVLNK